MTASLRRVASDMAELAQRVRAFLATTSGGTAVVPLGDGLFDVVVTAAGTDGLCTVAVMDEQQQPYSCGPVLAAPNSPWLRWLVPPCTAAR